LTTATGLTKVFSMKKLWSWVFRHRSTRHRPGGSPLVKQTSIDDVNSKETLLRKSIERREKIIAESGVRDVFTPAKPIDDASLFVGRGQEVRQIVGELNTPGQHALLWGDRGVGKTSLAKYLTMKFGTTIGVNRVFYVPCSTDSTFVGILKEPLDACGCDTEVMGTTRSLEGKAFGKVAVGLAEGSLEMNTQKSESRRGPTAEMTSTDACRYLKDFSALLVVDEAERIGGSDTRTHLAELLKQLSDVNAKFKVLIVGVAQAGADLVAHHESLVRCLKETHLRAMPHRESEEIVRSGMKKVGLIFDEEVISAIATISGGYAHYVHLLALKCSEVAIAAGEKHVDRLVLEQAMRLSGDEVEESLSTTYANATRSSANDRCKIILCAAATIDKIEFTSGELKDRVRSMGHKEMDQTYLNDLVSWDGHTILRRMKKGVYRFSDPRMPGYIKIANGMVPEDEPRVPLDRSSSR